MAQRIEGMLFDTAYLEPEIHLWIRTPTGRLELVRTPFVPTFYLAGPDAIRAEATDRLQSAGVAKPLGQTHRTEFWSGRPIAVMAMGAIRPSKLVAAVRKLLYAERRLQVYNVGIDTCLSFHSQHDLFPLAQVVVHHHEGRMVALEALEDPITPHWTMPGFRTMTLRLEKSPLLAMEEGNAILAQVDGEACRITEKNADEGLRALAGLLQRHDPDLIDSVRGDQMILPWLLEVSGRKGVVLPLDRLAPHVHRPVLRRGRSIVVYGQVIYKAPDYPLLGRWHLDRENSFFIAQAGLEGLVELARLSRIPIQRQARTSAGTAMTAMEIHLALQRGILVPFIKDQAEPFRSAADLLRADKGGLTYFPQAGLHENVIELDFAQQYPSLMLAHNISPETVNCGCCPDAKPVPGVDHRTCRRRRGLVPAALAGLLTQRSRYKALLKECPPEDVHKYEARACAIKWTLVTCFGYQGFKNAIFGIIPAHEAITAWGRETLLIAKEVFEEAGYRLLHALTDSLYLSKPEYTLEEVERLAQEVTTRTGITLALEGVYDWINFSPSKVRPQITAATRYFGLYSGGKLKIRGVMARQHSTPPFIHRAQLAFLQIMATCHSREQLQAALPKMRALYLGYARDLRTARVPVKDLLVRARVSRVPEAYRANSAVALCLRRLEAEGISVPPGQWMKYVIVDQKHPDPARRYRPEPLPFREGDYDARAYQSLLHRAYAELTANLRPEVSNLRLF